MRKEKEKARKHQAREKKSIVNNFAPGANYQVYNGNITGCIFAMPGANVTQQVTNPPTPEDEEEKKKAEGQKLPAADSRRGDEEPNVSSGPIVSQLKPIFYGSEDEALRFLKEIRGMKPVLITQKVKRLIAEKSISELSAHRDLWAILHTAGIYDRSESNWNQQVK